MMSLIDFLIQFFAEHHSTLLKFSLANIFIGGATTFFINFPSDRKDVIGDLYKRYSTKKVVTDKGFHIMVYKDNILIHIFYPEDSPEEINNFFDRRVISDMIQANLKYRYLYYMDNIKEAVELEKLIIKDD